MDYFNMVLPILLIAAMIPIIIIILGNFDGKNKNNIDVSKSNKKSGIFNNKKQHSFGKRGRGGLFD
jgi:L-asparagine transporter-like permease